MLNTICKGIDYLFNTSKIAEATQQEEMAELQIKNAVTNVILFDKATKGRLSLALVDGRRRALFNKHVKTMPKAKLTNGKKHPSQFVTAKTLYVERTKQNEIVVKFSRKDQIVLSADGTWHVKGDE